MPKSIAVFGAGPGLGRAVARRYAHDGYSVVLVARRPEPLRELAAQLSAEGAQVATLAADLSDGAAVAALADRIRACVGDPDAVYYGPTPGGGVQPNPGPPVRPSQLTAPQVEAYLPVALHALLALVGAFLPAMLERRAGAILAAGGLSAVRGVPYFSAPGVALAAQRNYLQALETELRGSGVFVGRLYVGATIRDSAWHRRIEAQRAAGEPVPTGDAIVDPEELADLLWTMHHASKEPELVRPLGILQ